MAGPGDATPVVEAQKRAPAEFQAVVKFLRGKNGPKVRRGALNGKRVDYFKGKTAIKALLSPAYGKVKKAPAVKDEKEASELLVKILPFGFFLRCDRPVQDPPTAAGVPKPLTLAPSQSFEPDAYYTWFYDGSSFGTIIGGVAMVVIMLAAVMFPLWPASLRLGVWYLSVGVLCLIGAFIGLAIVRLIGWAITSLVMKHGIWLFPNLFEDVGFVDSFIPLWAWDMPAKKKKKAAGTSTKSKSKSASPAAPAGPAGAVPEVAAQAPLGQQGMRKRQQAYVEELAEGEE